MPTSFGNALIRSEMASHLVLRIAFDSLSHRIPLSLLPRLHSTNMQKGISPHVNYHLDCATEKYRVSLLWISSTHQDAGVGASLLPVQVLLPHDCPVLELCGFGRCTVGPKKGIQEEYTDNISLRSDIHTSAALTNAQTTPRQMRLSSDESQG